MYAYICNSLGIILNVNESLPGPPVTSCIVYRTRRQASSEPLFIERVLFLPFVSAITQHFSTHNKPRHFYVNFINRQTVLDKRSFYVAPLFRASEISAEFYEILGKNRNPCRARRWNCNNFGVFSRSERRSGPFKNIIKTLWPDFVSHLLFCKGTGRVLFLLLAGASALVLYAVHIEKYL